MLAYIRCRCMWIQGTLWNHGEHDLPPDDRRLLRWAEELLVCLTESILPKEQSKHGTESLTLHEQSGKLMMAAAMWTKPHVIAFDEPTNYLDFQSLTCTAGVEGGTLTAKSPAQDGQLASESHKALQRRNYRGNAQC